MSRVSFDWGKRSFDVVASALVGVVALPLIVLVALTVRCALGRPVLFSQRRVGRSGQAFTILKFRTMTDAIDEQGRPLPDGDRLTRVGRFLRATSLDEAPQLWNVLRGEMSLVGPRPLLPEYLPKYTARQATRHEVRPGVTGLAQVCGRNRASWEERLEWDARYVEARSWRMDAWILLRTLVTVLDRRNVAAAGHATMPRFEGSTSIAALAADIAVVGSGGHARVVVDALLAAGKRPAVFDDDRDRVGQHLLGIAIRDAQELSDDLAGCDAIVAVGDNDVRRRLVERLTHRWVAVVHPDAHVSPNASVAPGAFVAAGAVVGAGATIASHAIVNTSSVVDHDAAVGSCAHVGPGAVLTGAVRLGAGVLFGAGARAIPGVSVGERARVGAGATVISDLPAHRTAVGVPARVVDRRRVASISMEGSDQEAAA